MTYLSVKASAALAGLTIAIGSATHAGDTNLRFGHIYPDGSVFDEAIERAAQALEEATDNRYGIDVFPNSELGNESALNDALSVGSVDMIYTGPAFLAQSLPEVAIADYPYVFRDLDHWQAFWDSDLLAGLMDDYSNATGNVFVTETYYGVRHVTSNTPVEAPSDMEGLKIRVPNAPAYLMMPRATGANPTPMAFNEVYLALQQGTVDAQENPLPTIVDAQFYEVQSDISLTGHITATLVTLVSGVTLDSLSNEDRDAVFTALEDAADWATDEIRARESELQQYVADNGMTVHEVDRQAFVDAVQPRLTNYDEVPWDQETFEAMQALGQ